MSASDARVLVQYLRLRARRERLAKHPVSTKDVQREEFTAAEVERLTLAETQLNRLRGTQMLELIVTNRDYVLTYLTK